MQVSWRLRVTLAAMHRAGRLTEGRFDASVLVDLERIGEHGAPLDERPRPAGHEAATGEPAPLDRPCLVRVPAAPVDAGGMGKGLALRWAADRAARHLPPGAGLLLEAGGDVVTSGAPPADGWLVGIQDPAAGGAPDAEPVAVLRLGEGAVATSSVLVRHWTGPDGRQVHHLLDPRTREPARTGLIAVSVAAADPAWSEVWSKALFLTGRSGIGDEARARGIAAWWIDETGHLGMTPEARVRSAWVAEARLG